MDTTRKWQAKWIQDEAFADAVPLSMTHKQTSVRTLPEHRRELQNRHMLVRKTFTLSSEELGGGSLQLDITADDYYKLYINGAFVSQGPAQGYPFHYPYNRLDVADWLRKGRNVIAVHVYYQGLINRAYNSGDYRQGMIAELYAGERLLLATDATWKYRLAEQYEAGGIAGNDTQFLENIDSRREERGWREAAYDDSDWRRCHVSQADDHMLALQPTPPLAVYTRRPTSVTAVGAGHYVIDFGEELTGQFTMQAHGQAGERIEIRCGEELDDAGERVRYEMRCNCSYREYWTLSGAKDELEGFEYKAFRYVEVIGPPSAILAESFAAVVRHYPFDDASCKLETSNPLFNRIWTICKNGVKYGSQETFVDCPSREKGQYLGDNTIIAHAHMYASGDLRLTKKALTDFALSARHICPGGMAVAPGSLMQEIADYSFQWPMQLLEYYRQSGDIAFLREMEPVAAEMVGYFDRYKREDGLLANITDKWNLVDWPDGMRDGYDFPLTQPVGPGCHNVVNAFYYGAQMALAEIREELQLEAGNGLREFKEAFVAAFFDPEQQRFVDAVGSRHASLHANALPLLFGLAPEGGQEAVVAWLKSRGMSCGVYFSYFLLKALAAAGEYEYVYELLAADDEHSWGNMVKEGATTCFEAWGKEQKWNTSLCHPWASAPIPLFIEEIIGLRPGAPGWDAIRLNPHIPAALESFTFECRVRTGVIRIGYDRGQWEIETPANVELMR